MPTTSYINLEKQLGANNYKPLDVILCRGEGVWVWDVDNKRYLDCLASDVKIISILYYVWNEGAGKVSVVGRLPLMG